MPRSLHFDIEISDAHADAIEAIKSLLMSSPDTGITNQTSLEEVYCELANVGLAMLTKDMMSDGSYEKCMDEVRLGNEIDELLE